MKIQLLEGDVRKVWPGFANCDISSPYHDHAVLNHFMETPGVSCISSELGDVPILVVLECGDGQGYAASPIPGDSILIAGKLPPPALFELMLDEICLKLGRCLYFPLVYENSKTATVLRGIQTASWTRPPSPVVSAAALVRGLKSRAIERIGDRCLRRLRKFRDSEANVETYQGAKAMEQIHSIELKSWKAEVGQDLWARKQVELYKALLDSGNTTVRVAFQGNEPIAYRMDYRAGRIVYCLKWSFSENARNISPGFHLLVEDLEACWKGSEIDFIDLHGSPDTLKNTICEHSGSRMRTDFGWPNGSPEIQAIAHERQSHDDRLKNALEKGNGIRKAYAG